MYKFIFSKTIDAEVKNPDFERKIKRNKLGQFASKSENKENEADEPTKKENETEQQVKKSVKAETKLLVREYDKNYKKTVENYEHVNGSRYRMSSDNSEHVFGFEDDAESRTSLSKAKIKEHCKNIKDEAAKYGLDKYNLENIYRVFTGNGTELTKGGKKVYNDASKKSEVVSLEIQNIFKNTEIGDEVSEENLLKVIQYMTINRENINYMRLKRPDIFDILRLINSFAPYDDKPQMSFVSNWKVDMESSIEYIKNSHDPINNEKTRPSFDIRNLKKGQRIIFDNQYTTRKDELEYNNGMVYSDNELICIFPKGGRFLNVDNFCITLDEDDERYIGGQFGDAYQNEQQSTASGVYTIIDDYKIVKIPGFYNEKMIIEVEEDEEKIKQYRDLCYKRLSNCKGKTAMWYWNEVANNRRLLLK